MLKNSFLLVTLIIINLFVSSTAYGKAAPPTIKSKAAVMIDAKTGAILFEKNADASMYPASLTKMATAIYAIENGNLNVIVTVSEKARNTDGTKVYLEKGEQVTLRKLIQGLLINSGNDAGVAIAEHLSGNLKTFSTDINNYLKEKIKVKHTHFQNPHGLYDPEHQTTAKDLAKITQYALKNETFKEIFGTKKLKWNGKTWDTTLLTHHKLLRGEIPYEGITGGKTGFVNESGYTLATSAKRDDLSLIVITLNSRTNKDAYDDTTKLLDYGFNHFQRDSIEAGKIFEIGTEKFQATKQLFFTHLLNDVIDLNIKNDGTLQIKDGEGDVIQSFDLQEVNEEASNHSSSMEEDETKDLFQKNSSMWLLITALLLLSSFAILRQRFRK
ncbi:D-alanyl-D-alanine carboxypeptidase family protein [Bacillus tianshenii]|nr:D-alanyl-D-alanine carboxypeptidase family protein [Bacillus tianshenii]